MVAGVAFSLTRNGNLTLLVSGSFLFSGLMFGPDLDIYSQQYKRWGILRWMWLPYRNSMRHRSLLSHGFLVGTVGRLIYLVAWIAVVGSGAILVGAIAQQLLHTTPHWQIPAQQHFGGSTQLALQIIQNHPQEFLAIAVGCELGAMSHSLSDWIGSAIKRRKKQTKR